MKIIYIAHPVAGDIQNNLKKIIGIVRQLNISHSDIIPFAPYYVDVNALDDRKPIERARGMRNNEHYFRNKIVNELWLFGSEVSPGMEVEIRLARAYDIPVFPMTVGTITAYRQMIYLKKI